MKPNNQSGAVARYPRVVPETADAQLLAEELGSIADIEEIEQIPLEARLKVVDFPRRIELALTTREANAAAILYVADGDIDREAQRIAFATLQGNIARTASLLRRSGIGPSDVVAILLPNVPAVYWAILGSMSIGIAFPVNWMLGPAQVLHLLREANAKAVIALGPTPDFKIWESLMAIRPQLSQNVRVWSVMGPGGSALPQSDLDGCITEEREPVARERTVSGDTIAAYLHSGGTTGLPKIVKLSHRNFSYRHWTVQLASKAVVGEVVLHDTPMFHVGGLIGRSLSALASGATMLIPSIMGARDKRYMGSYWKFIEKYRVTRLSGVPTTLATLAKSPPEKEDLSCLKPYFITGSTAMPKVVRENFERISGVQVLNSYGLTENTAAVAIEPRDGKSKEGSSGIRLPYTKIRVVKMDEKGGATAEECQSGEIGMLQVSGPGVTPGYLNPMHERSARTADGWLITGDLGRVDGDGYLYVTGRAKDVIIRGGHNIDPAVIEDALLKCSEVLHVAAVGKPDAYAGELPVAYVELVAGSKATGTSLVALAEMLIPERAAIPKEIIIVPRMLLTDVGKPMKAALRRDAAERTFRSVLTQAVEATGLAAKMQVEVDAHPPHGTLVTIRMSEVDPEKRNVAATRVKELMEQYSYAYVIQWGTFPG